MITAIDKAGRIVVPKRLRDAMGLTPKTPLRIDVIDGRLIVEFAPAAHIVELADGFPVIRSEGDPGAPPVTDEAVRDALEEARASGRRERLPAADRYVRPLGATYQLI